jgi:hypothetical protein
VGESYYFLGSIAKNVLIKLYLYFGIEQKVKAIEKQAFFPGRQI